MIIGFIGTGNMGGAILKGYIRSSAHQNEKILIHNRNSEHNNAMANKIKETMGGIVTVCNDNRELASEADIIIIGVKPDGVMDVLREIAPELSESNADGYSSGKLIVSMAAGITIADMEAALNEKCEGLGEHAKIIRIMPNTPALVCEAMTSMSRNRNVTEGDMLRVKEIFDTIGIAEEVAEEEIDCIVGVSGSSTAYTFMYIGALIQAAVDNGMAEDKARIFAAKAVRGAAEMVLRSDESINQLVQNVCSPKGTTIEAVNKLLENGFMEDVKEGFQAAVDRSKEMSGVKRY